ncbi:MAG: LPS export ABC transporter periplasmic protein LptC [Spirochaetes bacterium]|nr:LPS export ABC transporter periplasmic protein LptC [Spirochaetota bacterium]
MRYGRRYRVEGGIRVMFFALLLSLSIVTPGPCFEAFGGGERPAAEEEFTEETSVPDYILYEVVHHHYENGSRKVKILFDKGRYFSNGSELLVEKCRFVYYDRKGDVISSGSSNRARLFEEGTQLVAEENVIVISEENGGRLDTEYLEWHEDTNQFTTDRFVTITQKNGDMISGIGMVADIGLKKVTIKRDVKGSFREK